MIDRAAEAGTAEELTVDEAAHELARCLARIIARRHHREAERLRLRQRLRWDEPGGTIPSDP